MTVAFYVSSHGFGHFVRAAEVMKTLSREIPIILRTEVPAWFIEQELAGVNYVLHPARFDCGTLGNDSTQVDPAMTFRRAAEVLKKNEGRIESEISFLREKRVRVVVSDVPSFPLRVAREAGVPSILISNFTWVEIYAKLTNLASKAGETAMAGEGARVTAEFRKEYAMGKLLLVPGLALEMSACEKQRHVPIIARQGCARREILCERLSFDPRRPIYLLYLGQDGYSGIDWLKLGNIDGGQFFSFRSVPGKNNSIVRVLGEGTVSHSDATASADAVVGKLGYSLCAECVATGRPLLFPPRPDFAEAEALEKAMVEYGLGVPLTDDSFRALDWADGLKRAAELKKEMEERGRSIPCDGAQACAEIIARTWREGRIPLEFTQAIQ